MKTPIIINGKRIGRWRASILLFRESWRFLAADKELMLIPLITMVLNFVLFGLLFLVAAAVSRSLGVPVFTGDNLQNIDYVYLFGLYVIGAFTLALAQAATVNTVYTRIHGGNASLGESLRIAFSHSGTLFVWALITSTVGLILKSISDRSQILGKIVTSLLGAGWVVVTFFVIPSIVITKKSAFEAIPHSLSTFKRTWGETFISNITLGVAFFLMYLVAIAAVVGLIIGGIQLQNSLLIIIAIILGVLWIIFASLAQSALQGILKTLLYVYATEDRVPSNFNSELLEAMLGRQKPTVALTSTTVVGGESEVISYPSTSPTSLPPIQT